MAQYSVCACNHGNEQVLPVVVSRNDKLHIQCTHIPEYRALHGVAEVGFSLIAQLQKLTSAVKMNLSCLTFTQTTLRAKLSVSNSRRRIWNRLAYLYTD